MSTPASNDNKLPADPPLSPVASRIVEIPESASAASYPLGSAVEVLPAYRMVQPNGGRLVSDQVTGKGWFVNQLSDDGCLGLGRVALPNEVEWWVDPGRVQIETCV